MNPVTVLTLGTFDTPHIGHAAFLAKAARLGSRLIVGVNSDRFVEEYKGHAPMFTQAERMALVSTLGYEVVVNDGPGRATIIYVSPEVLAVGSDWLERDYTKQIGMTAAELREDGVTVAFVPYTSGISSTLLKERIGAATRAG